MVSSGSKDEGGQSMREKKAKQKSKSFGSRTIKNALVFEHRAKET